jgi:hypothetical protein
MRSDCSERWTSGKGNFRSVTDCFPLRDPIHLRWAVRTREQGRFRGRRDSQAPSRSSLRHRFRQVFLGLHVEKKPEHQHCGL